VRALSPDRAAGVVITLVGAWFLWQAFQFREGPGYAAIGPRVFPAIVGLGLLASGAALAVFAAREPNSGLELDWRRLAMLAAALAVYVAMYLPLGFPLASLLFFVAGAWVLGSRALLRDAAAGLALVVVVFLVFTRLLGIPLPAGPFDGLI
jgi:putative tricarboxylic transport membrane protein